MPCRLGFENGSFDLAGRQIERHGDMPPRGMTGTRREA
jgi:hypothetical protein